MHVSELMEIKCKGHKNFDFVDIRLDKDNRLFIDPCLMEEADDPWCIQASHCMAAFFDCLYTGFKNGTIRHSPLRSHAREQNAIKLGYGNGSNGKGKTPLGLYESLEGLSAMTTWGYRPEGKGKKPIWFFDAAQKLWRQEVRPCWFYQGKELLAAPEWQDLKKADMRHNLPHEDRHWEYDHVIKYSREHPEALAEYHKVLPIRYNRARGIRTFSPFRNQTRPP